MKFGNNVDLNLNQLLNVVLGNVPNLTDSQNRLAGHIYYDSAQSHVMLYTGTPADGSWHKLLMDAEGELSGNYFAKQSPNLVLAGPVSGNDNNPSFRSLVVADLPTITVAKGGTGKTSVSANSMLYASSANVYAEVTTTSFGRGLLNKQKGEIAHDNAGIVFGGDIYDYTEGRLADYATNTELAASNNAIAENRARIDDIESLLSAPNFGTAYIGELGVEGINLGGVDIWNEGDVAVVGGSLTAKMSSTSDAFVKAENSRGQIGLLASVSRGVWDYSRSTPNWLIATDGTNTWLSCGNVGIGTPNPSANLHVVGTFNATDAATLGGTLSVDGTATFKNSMRINGGTNRIYFGDSSDEYIEFVDIAASGQPALYALHTTLPFYSDSWIASGGVGSSGSGGGGGGYNAVTWTDIQSGTGPGLSSEDNSYLPTAYALLQTYVIANNTYSLITGTNGLAVRVSNLETSRATTTYVDTAVSGLRADLIENNKIKTSLLPDFIMGQMLFGGNVTSYVNATTLGITASTNFLRWMESKKGYAVGTLTGKAIRVTSGSSSQSGNIYTFSSADCEGSYFLFGSGAIASGDVYREWNSKKFEVGDWLVSVGSSWQKIDNTDAVVSVNNKTGAVTITKDDVELGDVENTPLSTWTGTQNITTLGTITAGTWHGSQIADAYISSATSWNGAVQLANELDAKMDALQVALPNAIAENRSRIDDIESWMVKPNAAEAYVGELGTMGINLGGVDIWNAGEEVNIGGALRVDKASSFNNYINLVGTSKKIYFGGTDTNDPFLEFVNIAASGQPALYALHTNLPFYSDSWIASGGIGSSSGGGGGIVSAIYTEYTQDPAQNSVYSASFVNDIHNKVNSHDSSLSSLNTRVGNIEANGATNIVVPDNGDVLTGASKSGNTITFTKGALSAGTGLAKSNLTFSLASAYQTRSFATDVTMTGETSATVTHNLNTKYVGVFVYDGNEMIMTDVTTNDNSITLTFSKAQGTASASKTYRVFVVGRTKN